MPSNYPFVSPKDPELALPGASQANKTEADRAAIDPYHANLHKERAYEQVEQPEADGPARTETTQPDLTAIREAGVGGQKVQEPKGTFTEPGEEGDMSPVPEDATPVGDTEAAQENPEEPQQAARRTRKSSE